jgi:hypothetical protein
MRLGVVGLIKAEPEFGCVPKNPSLVYFAVSGFKAVSFSGALAFLRRLEQASKKQSSHRSEP